MDFPAFSQLWTAGSFPGMSRWQQIRPSTSHFSGMAGSAAALLATDIFSCTKGPLLAVTPDSRHAEKLFEECATLAPPHTVLFFPDREPVPYNRKSPFGPTVENRYKVYSALLEGTPRIVITPAVTLLQRVPAPRELFNRIIDLHVGDTIEMHTLATWLLDNGFRRELQTQDLGTFSIRGNICDIYPFLCDDPFRIEFWGDTIDSIRAYDVFSQKSKQQLFRIQVFPMREMDLNEAILDRGMSLLERHDASSEQKQRLVHQWKMSGDFEGIEWYRHWFEESPATLRDYFATPPTTLWLDIRPPLERFQEIAANYQRHFTRLPEPLQPLVSAPAALLHDTAVVDRQFEESTLVFVGTQSPGPVQFRHECGMEPQPRFPENIDFLTSHCERLHREGVRQFFICQNSGNAQRLAELISEKCPYVTITTGLLYEGLYDKESAIALYAEAQLYHRTFRRTGYKKFKSGSAISGYDELSPGDYIVHVDHGIGRFRGIQKVRTGDFSQDCMLLLFGNNARLFVPIKDFHKVRKYINRESFSPRLSKLGSPAWEKTKRKTRESLKEMATELVNLYASRQCLEGIKMSLDTTWQKEFEEGFMYEETPDQTTTITAVKKDMESGRPMDRLVCGDVGFGKTEIAMRAAFKAVMAGYQVAVLAPTTILAEQHYHTFTERMANFPVEICVLSRFLKPSLQKKVVRKAGEKKVDILIGTHRLLSKDVHFANLGLLVVDEEQKFGVRHKEKIKTFRKKIDVLSMTATPIPRTLHMSLAGVRDLSLVSTPPRNRLPVETHVAEYSEELIQTAIENELERGGQVYVVHNRIKNLELLKDAVERLVPAARVVLAHGQMKADELEYIMEQFIQGRSNVLVSTVIIENGLDIANVNTIIVNRADTMGLSQLYQLRGRVGRSADQAYAWLFTPPFKKVDEKSLRRLQALEQYTDLGSGFQIAMRDLEIRGAGDLLGTRQHGFIAAVGFDLYCRLLEEAVNEIKGTPSPAHPKEEISIDIPSNAAIPGEYVKDLTTRITMYQQISEIDSREGLAAFTAETLDRFGPIPTEMHLLLECVKIKLLAARIGCNSIRVDSSNQVACTFGGDEQMVKKNVAAFVQKKPAGLQIDYGPPLSCKIPLNATSPEERITHIQGLLEQISPSFHNQPRE